MVVEGGIHAQEEFRHGGAQAWMLWSRIRSQVAVLIKHRFIKLFIRLALKLLNRLRHVGQSFQHFLRGGQEDQVRRCGTGIHLVIFTTRHGHRSTTDF